MTTLLDRPAGPVAPATGPGPAGPDEVRRSGARLLAIGCAWVVAIGYVAHASLPPNAVHLPYERATSTALVVPQGWAFFTKSPREAGVEVVVRGADGAWRDAWGDTGGAPSRWFGAVRGTRHDGVEAGLLAGGIPAAAWRHCTVTPTDCVATAPVAETVTNRSPHPRFCGDLALVRQQPVPWAWRSVRHVTMPSEVLRLEVRC